MTHNIDIKNLIVEPLLHDINALINDKLSLFLANVTINQKTFNLLNEIYEELPNVKKLKEENLNLKNEINKLNSNLIIFAQENKKNNTKQINFDTNTILKNDNIFNEVYKDKSLLELNTHIISAPASSCISIIHEKEDDKNNEKELEVPEENNEEEHELDLSSMQIKKKLEKENYETCDKLLEESNYDIMVAIKKYYNIEKKEENKNKTSNTILFDTIRGVLDEASEKYYREKDLQEAKEKIVEKYRKGIKRDSEISNTIAGSKIDEEKYGISRYKLNASFK